MKKISAVFTVAAMLFTLATTATHAEENAMPTEPLTGTMKDIDGKDVDLTQYKGQVVMIVNVASKCGLTPQYEQLQALYDKYKEKGFTILGFPANDFMQQEPGTESEIKAFCQTKYDVTFDLFSKITVKGEDAPPLYKYLVSEETNKEFAGEIEWNFAKFLLNRKGEVIARYNSRTKPDEKEVLEAIEAALAEEAPEKQA